MDVSSAQTALRLARPAPAPSRVEFYPFYVGALTLQAINKSLKKYQKLYNDYRPHQALDLMTPNEYLQYRRAA